VPLLSIVISVNHPVVIIKTKFPYQQKLDIQWSGNELRKYYFLAHWFE